MKAAVFSEAQVRALDWYWPVEFEIVGDSVRMRKARKPTRMTRGEMIVAHLRGTGNKRYRSTDELMKLLRGED